MSASASDESDATMMAQAGPSLDKLKKTLYDNCRALPASELLQHATDLQGKVVLVTGAASGIGAAFCLLASTLGAKLILVDRNKAAIDSLAQEIEGNIVTGEAHAAARTSVTDWEELRATFEWADKEFGRIDSVVCCAGVTEMPPRFDADTFDDYGKLKAPNLRTLDVNLIGSLYTTKLALHYMRKRKSRGSIVLLGSLSSLFGLPLAPIYTSTKHALLGFTRSISVPSSADGINVNMIAPWFVKTPILDAPIRLLLSGLPYAKMGDVVNAIVFAANTQELSGAALPVVPEGVFLFPAESQYLGDFGLLSTLSGRLAGLIGYVKTIKDVLEIIGGAVLGPLAIIIGLLGVAYYYTR